MRFEKRIHRDVYLNLLDESARPRLLSDEHFTQTHAANHILATWFKTKSRAFDISNVAS
jgi:hypothetical protein